MRYVKIDKVNPGDIPAKDIVTYVNGNLLRLFKVSDDNPIPLSPYIISRLAEKGIKGIYIEDEISKGIKIENAIDDGIRNLALNALDKKNIHETEKIANKIVEEFRNVSEIDLNRMMNETSYIEKAITICELAITLGKKLNYTSANLDILATSSLLAEVGYILTDKEKEQLNISPNYNLKEAILKMPIEETYPLIGKILVSNAQLNPLVIHSILFHKENENGTGLMSNMYFKLGHQMKKYEIRDTAKIIHICTDYVNKLIETNNPITAREEIARGVLEQRYNQDLAIAFLKFIPIYPIGTIVILSNNERAIIMKNNNELPEYPVVRLESGEIIDLKVTHNVVIDHIEMNEQDLVK